MKMENIILGFCCSGSVKLPHIGWFCWKTYNTRKYVEKSSQVTKTFKRPGSIFDIISQTALKAALSNAVFKMRRKLEVYKTLFISEQPCVTDYN
jgi:hypothetical protein